MGDIVYRQDKYCMHDNMDSREKKKQGAIYKILACFPTYL
jgi:hypothetical protein